MTTAGSRGARIRRRLDRAWPRINATPESIADHTPRPRIENGGEINETRCYSDVSEVGNPELVRRGGRQILGQIGEDGPVVIAVGRRHVASTGPHSQVVFLHQPHDLLVVDNNPCRMELGRYTPIAVGGPFGSDLLDLISEPGLFDRPVSTGIVEC